MKTIYLWFMLMLGMFSAALAADPIDRVAELVGKGNIAEIAKLFPDNVDMGIQTDVETYTKAQAIQQLQKFFAQNKPTGAKLLHKVTSNPKFHMAVIALNTDKGMYRVSCTLKDNNGVMQLVEVRIEGERK